MTYVKGPNRDYGSVSQTQYPWYLELVILCSWRLSCTLQDVDWYLFILHLHSASSTPHPELWQSKKSQTLPDTLRKNSVDWERLTTKKPGVLSLKDAGHFLSDYCCKMETQTHYQQTINILNRNRNMGILKISKHSVLKYWYISVFPLLFLEYDYKDWIFESFQEILCWVTSNKGTQISIKCVSEIGHFWILANKEREWWYRTLEGCRAAWNHGESCCSEKDDMRNLLDFRLDTYPLLVLSSTAFPCLGCSKAVSVIRFGDHDNGIARDCPFTILALKEKIWLIRGKCIIISHPSTICTICWFIYLRDSVHNLLEINIFIKPAILKIFNSFVLRLCSLSYT